MIENFFHKIILSSSSSKKSGEHPEIFYFIKNYQNQPSLSSSIASASFRLRGPVPYISSSMSSL